MAKNVLILCTGNSCRSQMAEALWQDLGQGEWQAYSAGSKPAGYVHPMAIEAIGELGLDISNNESKHLDQFLDQPLDMVVTVCGSAHESCPVFPGDVEVAHWPFEDPAYAEGSDEVRRQFFRDVRDQIREKIAAYLK